MFALVCLLCLAPVSAPQESGRVSTAPGSFEPVRIRGDDPDGITGLVRDAARAPVGGATLTAIATPRSGCVGLFAEQADARAPETRSDAQGRFRLAAARGRAYELRVAAPDGTIGYVPACFAGEALSIVLARPAEIRVHAFDARSRTPLAGVEIAAQWLETNSQQQFGVVPHGVSAAITDREGFARLAGLPPALLDIAYEPYAAGLAHARAWRVLAGEASTLELPVAERFRTLRGRVADGAMQPLAGARVSNSLRFERSVETDAEGRFTLHAFVPDEGLTLYAQDTGFALTSLDVASPSAQDDVPLLVLHRGRTVRGRVVDAQGAPVAGAGLAFVNEETWSISPAQAQDLVFGHSDAGGEFVVQGLRADVRHLAVVSSSRQALEMRALPDDELGSTELDLGRIVLQAPQSISGTFVEADGTPIPDANVMLTLTAPIEPAPAGTDPRGGYGRVDRMFGSIRTDCLGRFRFERVPPGALTLHGTSKRLLPPVRLRLTALDARDDVVLRQSEQAGSAPSQPGCGLFGRIAAHVLTSDGRPAARVSISVYPEDFAADPLRTAFSDEAGAFVIEPLPPGCYRAVLELRDGFADAAPLRARRLLSTLEFQAFAQADPDAPARTLHLCEVIRVHGRVVDPGHDGPRSWLLSVSSSSHPSAAACVASTPDGSFEFWIEAGARLTLLVTPLADEASVPRSALGAGPPPRFLVRDVEARADEMLVPVPR